METYAQETVEFDHAGSIFLREARMEIPGMAVEDVLYVSCTGLSMHGVVCDGSREISTCPERRPSRPGDVVKRRFEDVSLENFP